MPHCVPVRKRRTGRKRDRHTEWERATEHCVSMRMRNAEAANNANKQPKKNVLLNLFTAFALYQCHGIRFAWMGLFFPLAGSLVIPLKASRYIVEYYCRIAYSSAIKWNYSSLGIGWHELPSGHTFYSRSNGRIDQERARERERAMAVGKKTTEKMWIKHVEKSPEH